MHKKPMFTTIPCGSELARDSGPSGNINTDCYTAIASKPTPTECSTAHKTTEIPSYKLNTRFTILAV
ncbi:hypothetical protein SRABI06_04030 [Pseudomonas brassicacearum]|nr:hypothetical protein SRABI06_04030 [Pseudomonas brassicacearum]